MEVLFEDFFICKPRIKLNSPIILISNSLLVRLENSSHIDSDVAPKMISSIYT